MYLPSLLATTYDNKQIYVIDNNSTDGSVEMLAEHFPTVTVVRMYSNLGFATGYNLCLSQIDTDYFILVNSDIEVTPGFIEPVISLMETDSKIGLCQPKLLSFHEKNKFEYAGAAGGYMDKLGFPFAKGRVLLSIEEDRGQYDSNTPIFWASGACMFMKRTVYEKIGGFYDYYYMHQEDIDFCWRAQLAGFRILSCPQSQVYHVGGGSLSWESNLKTFLTFRNNYILLSRNLKRLQLPLVIPLRLILDFLGSLYFLLKFKPGISKAILKAIFAYFYWLLFSGEQRTFTGRGLENCEGVYKGTILWPYFFLKKRKFSEIVENKSSKNEK